MLIDFCIIVVIYFRIQVGSYLNDRRTFFIPGFALGLMDVMVNAAPLLSVQD